MSDLIFVVAHDGRVTWASPSVGRLVAGWPGSAVPARWEDVPYPEDRPGAVELVRRAQAEPGTTACARLRVLAAREDVRWMDARAVSHAADPAIDGVVVTCRDVTDQRAAEATLERLALEDPLTGMPNRRWFATAARKALARAARSGRHVGLVVIDVDDFRRVNDSLGHPAGDRLLVRLARRMAATLRPGDTVARLGGDEFVVLTEDLRDPADVLAVARRTVDAATGRYTVGPDVTTRVTLSAGASTGGLGADADALLSQADAALHEAKRSGRSHVSLFDPALRAHLRRRLRVEQELHRAIEGDQLVLHWQPIVDARDGTSRGAEALVRWQHPVRGLLGPDQFLPIAEESGLVPQLGAWVIDAALAQAARWAELPGDPRVFINLAAEQVCEPALAGLLTERAATHGIDPGRVLLEISERMLTSTLDATSELVAALRGRGFGIALDDFGAGNTALAWLRRLPIDILKLDRQFTMGLDEPATRAIVAAISQMAPALGVTSLAEGVETSSQLAALRELGCDYAQGFHFSRPVPAADATALLGGTRERRFASRVRRPARSRAD